MYVLINWWCIINKISISQNTYIFNQVTIIIRWRVAKSWYECTGFRFITFPLRRTKEMAQQTLRNQQNGSKVSGYHKLCKGTGQLLNCVWVRHFDRLWPFYITDTEQQTAPTNHKENVAAATIKCGFTHTTWFQQLSNSSGDHSHQTRDLC